MSEASLFPPPAYIPPVLPEMPAPPQNQEPSHHIPWIFVGLLAVIVAILLSLVAWTVFSRQSFRTAQQAFPTEPTLTGAEDTFKINATENLAQAESWQDPLSSHPCYVWAQNTCQFSFNLPQADGVRLQTINLPKNQERQDLFFLVGRMLSLRTGMYGQYQSSLVTGVEPQPFLTLTDDILAAGLAHKVNPAFLFALYDRLFQITGEFGWSANQVRVALAPDQLAQDLARYSVDPTLAQTPLGKKLAEKGWGAPSQALAYTLSLYLNPDVVSSMLGQDGALESHYYELFAPSQLLGQISLQFEPTPISLDEAFPANQENSPYHYALCKLWL